MKKVKQEPGARKRRSLEYRDSLWGYSFITPMFVGFVIITVLPIIATFYFSLTDKNLMARNTNFVGLENYAELLDDKIFHATIMQTIEFALILMPTNILLSMGLALLLKDKFRGCGFFRTAVFTPVVISVVVWGVLWKYIFKTDNGLINDILKMMGIQGPQWLNNLKLSIPITAFVTLIKGVGMNMVLFIGAFLDVPKDYTEAAALDGANKWKQFVHITLPTIAPTIFLVMILTTINALKVFGQINVMTGGGPGTSSYVFVYYIYQLAFKYYRFGYASAVSVVLFLVIVALTLTQWSLRKKWVYHEE